MSVKQVEKMCPYCHVLACCYASAESHMLFLNPETSISIQKRHSYIRNINSESLGTLKTRFYIVGMQISQQSGFIWLI